MLLHIEKPDTFNGCASSNIILYYFFRKSNIYTAPIYLVYYWVTTGLAVTARTLQSTFCRQGFLSHVIQMADTSNCTFAESPVVPVVTIVSIYTAVAVRHVNTLRW